METLSKIAHIIRDVVTDKYPHGGGGEIVKEGADGDPTKQIDKLAEDTAIGYLEDHGIDWNIISEESGWIDRGGDRILVFDPIDGTYNAVNGIPFYSTSLALTENNESMDIHSGVVYNIPSGICFKATKGEGAFMDGCPIHTRSFPVKDAVFSSFLGPDSMEENRKILTWPRRGRYFGSISLEICLVARGSLDLFALFSRVPRITDIAAAHLILKEAGGEHYKVDLFNNWSNYVPGDSENIKGILSIGDKNAVDMIREYSEAEN